MNKSSGLFAASIAVIAALSAQSASASVMLTTSLNNVLPINAVLYNFNASDPNYAAAPTLYSPLSAISTSGAIVTFDPGAYLATGNIGGVVAAPIVGQSAGPDTNAYLAAEPNANVTIDFGGNQQVDFGLLWGSIDTYNTLTFYDGGSQVASFTGSDVTSTPNGYQGYGGSSYVNFLFNGQTFDKVVASSTQPAFEFDYVKSLAADGPPPVFPGVPEPGTWAMMMLGLVGLGAALRLRRREGLVAA